MTTINYTASQFAAGFTGPVSLTKNPDRIYFIGARTIWIGRIKGSSAILNAFSDWGSGDGMVMVSVDGGPFVAAPRDESNYTLFDGEQDERLVCIRFSLSISQNVYINNTGTVLTVEGDDVGVTLFADRVQFGEETDYACFAAVGQPAPTDYLPAYLIAANGPLGSNIASAKVRGAFTEIAVVCASLSVYVSINGGEPTRYLAPETPAGYSRVVVISGLSGELATYNIWTEGDDNPINYSIFAIYGDAEFQNIGTKKRIFQFGDRSTSGGLSGSTRGDVETMQVAAHFGYAGTTDATTAWNTSTTDVSSIITTALAGIDATDDDVAILSVGRNESAALVSYQECVEKLLAGGFGTVLCRGVLPEGTNVWPDHAATIQNVIATIGDPRVHFIDTSTWQPIDRPDGTNPSPVGFLELAEFAKVGYAEFLSEESGNEYSHTAEGGLELDGAAGFSTVAAFAATGGVSLGGSAIWGEAWDQSHTGTGGLVLGGSAGFSSVSNFQVSGGLNLGGRAIIRLPSDENTGEKPMTFSKHDKAIAFYNFENNSNLGADVSGYERHGAASDVSYVESLDGKSKVAHFDASQNGGIDLTEHLPLFKESESFSFSAWIYASTIDSVQRTVFSLSNDEYESRDFRLMVTNTGRIWVRIRQGTTVLANRYADNALTANTWHLVSFSTGPSGLRIWVDGVLATSDESTASVSAVEFNRAQLGYNVNNSGKGVPFDGYMKDVFMSTTELTTSTVSEIYNRDIYGYEVIHLMGQSNQVGTPSIEPGIDDDYSIVAGKVFQWGWTTRAVAPAQNTLEHALKQDGDMGQWLEMCNKLVPHLAYKRGILLTPVARGATRFYDPGDWNPGDTHYEDALVRMNESYNRHAFSKLSCCHWMQGESDAFESGVAIYQERIEAMYNDMLSRCEGFSAEVPFICVTINGSATPSQVGPLNQKLAAFVAAGPSRYLINSTDLEMGTDPLHYTAASLRAIGRRSAAVFITEEEEVPIVAEMQVAYDPTTKLVTLQPAGANAPSGSEVIGGFDHTEEGDPLGYVGNHVLYHHVRDLLYKKGEYNMQVVTITHDLTPTFPEGGGSEE